MFLELLSTNSCKLIKLTLFSGNTMRIFITCWNKVVMFEVYLKLIYS